MSLKPRNLLPVWTFTLAAIILSACSSRPTLDDDRGPSHPIDWRSVKPVTPTNEPKSRYGNPASYEVAGITYKILPSAKGYRKKGVASWYGSKFHGRRTSSGEPYDMLQLTAAHKTLPIPCYVKVSNLDNGKSLVVRVNDRGPFVKGRIIDLSYVAAHKLGMTEKGTANVIVETVQGRQLNRNEHRTIQRQSVSEEGKGRFRYVQVGAYANHKTAQKLAKVLDREINLPVKITHIKRKGKKLYRVRIGPIADLAVAQDLASTLNIKALGSPRIVYQD